MQRLFAVVLGVVWLGRAAFAQEAGYSEDRVAPSRVPAGFREVAEKESPGVRFSVIYRDNGKAYRFLGRLAEGKTVSVRVDRAGKLETRMTYLDVATAKVPRPVAAAFKEELGKDPKLAGFKVERTWLVERYTAATGKVESYYEVYGHTPGNIHPRFEIDAAGRLLELDLTFLPSVEGRREVLTARTTPADVLERAAAALPGLKVTRVVRVSPRHAPNQVDYEVYGRVGTNPGRAAEVQLGPAGPPTASAVGIPLRDVPPPLLAAVARKAATEPELVGFEPAEARRLHITFLNEDQIQLLGDDPEGKPIEVRVKPDGEVSILPDSHEVDREEAGIAPTGPRPKRDVIPRDGFAVLAARYGVDHHWIDNTAQVRAALEEGLQDYVGTAKTPDPAYGRHKTTVLLYAQDSRVGLRQALDDKPLSLGGRSSEEKLADVPKQGFAVLAARFGFDERWQDVTDKVIPLVRDGHLDFQPATANLPDPAPGEPKALAVAYSVGGRVGLYVQSQWRSTKLPPEAGPISGGALLARSIEYPQKPSLVAFAPDGRSAVVGVEDGSVRVIEPATGRELRRLDGHGPGWVAVAVSGSGLLAASGGTDKTVRIWDLKAGREKAVLRGHAEGVFRVAFSPTNRYVASTAWDNTVRLWDVAAGRELRRFEGHTKFVAGLQFTPDGRRLVTSGWDRTARVWDVATGRELRQAEPAGVELGDLAIARGGKDVFLGVKDGPLRRWEVDGTAAPVAIDCGTDTQVAVAAFPDNRRFLVADRIAAVAWEARTGYPAFRLEAHTAKVTGVAAAPDGRTAATCSEDRTLKFWNLPAPPP